MIYAVQLTAWKLAIHIFGRRNIDGIVAKILPDHLPEYRLQNDRSRLRIGRISAYRGIFRTVTLSHWTGQFNILLNEQDAANKAVYAHEIGHIQLGHMNSDNAYSALYTDSPREKAEAEYFSRSFCRRLEGIDWLDGLEILCFGTYIAFQLDKRLANPGHKLS